jgi:hypothetical protein
VRETNITFRRSNNINQLGEIHEGAAEAIDLVDDDTSDQPG